MFARSGKSFSPRPAHSFYDHETAVTVVRIHPSGERIVSGTVEGVYCMSEMASEMSLGHVTAFASDHIADLALGEVGGVTDAAWSSDGSHGAIVFAEGRIVVVDGHGLVTATLVTDEVLRCVAGLGAVPSRHALGCAQLTPTSPLLSDVSRWIPLVGVLSQAAVRGMCACGTYGVMMRSQLTWQRGNRGMPSP